MLACSCLLALALSSVPLADGRSDGTDLAARLSDALAAPSLAGAKVGVYVKRLDDGRELFARDADVLFIPASNMKIVTSAAALHYLGPDFRYDTEVLGAADASGTVPGDVWVRGYGDPSLVPERLWYLANRVYFAGVREIGGNIIIDDSYFAGSRLANGWEQDKSDSAYMAPTGAVSVGFNVIQVHVLPSAVAGANARVLIDPTSAYTHVEGAVSTVSRGRSYVSVDVQPSGDRSKVRVAGRIHTSDPGRAFWRRIDNPPIFAGEVLKAQLEQVGVRVRGKIKVGAVPDGAPHLATVTSSRLADIVNYLNKSSNNFTAEQLALTVGAVRFGAPGTWEKAQTAIESFLVDEVGLKKDSFVVRNGSGLHDVNRLTPREIVAVLAHVHNMPQVLPEFVTSLAVAGGSGTLAERMQRTDADHLLRAKTGTLSNASALSGYVTTKSGETLAFSILVNDFQSGIADVWQVQDQLGALLAGLRSTPAVGNVAQKPKAEPLEVAAP